jgi:hypothetical protein
LEAFSSRLRGVAAVTQAAGFKDAVLSARDAPLAVFSSPSNRAARADVLPIALELESEMRDMATQFAESMGPTMSEAMKVCQETPCGGLTWLMDGSDWADGAAVGGSDTPCGVLNQASIDFVMLTLETRPDSELGSRAACFLRMAAEHDEPLAELNKTEDGRRMMHETFLAEKVVTPWLRSDEQYEEFKKLRDEAASSK